MKKIFALVMVLMLIASSSFAEKITFVEYASYHLGSGDSEVSAHEGARRECLKKAATAGGVYVQMYSKEKMFELTAHETEILAASIIKAVEIEGESGMSKDRMNYDITMECTLDTDDIYKALQNRETSNQIPATSAVSPVKKTEKLTNAHALVICCDEVSGTFKYLARDYLWVQSESGERVLCIENSKEKGCSTRVAQMTATHGLKSVMRSIHNRFGDDYKIVYAIDIKNPNEEDMPYAERKRPFGRHMIVVSDEDAEIIKQILSNNHGGIPYDYVQLTDMHWAV